MSAPHQYNYIWSKSRWILSVFMIFVISNITLQVQNAHADTNLATNPSFEITDPANPNRPQGWSQGHWGTNQPIFTYPVTGYNSARAARVEITQYTSGDAKWYFARDISVQPNQTYEVDDVYRSNISSYVTIRLLHTNGSYSYTDIGKPDSYTSWHGFQSYITIPADVTAINVFHLINNIGWLEVDNYVVKAVATDPTKLSQGIVSLNFDDGLLSQYTNALPVLDQSRLPATFYIITGRLDQSQFPDYVSASQVLNMQARGYEIGAHTRSHPYLTTLSDSQAWDEIMGSRQDLWNLGITPVHFFAYPFGDYDSRIEQIVKNAGFEAARSSDGGFNSKTQDIFALRRFSININTTVDDIKNAIDTARNSKTWLILLFHQVDNNGDTYDITPDSFKAVINYLKQANTPVVNMEQGFQLLQQKSSAQTLTDTVTATPSTCIKPTVKPLHINAILPE